MTEPARRSIDAPPAPAALTLRNKDYVSDEVQDRIRRTRLLVAGCGLGSTFAEAAVRLGFENFILVDGDRVEPHNLNRQIYDGEDIGRPKTHALERRLRSVNPDLSVIALNANVDGTNVRALVEEADVVFDTIDFLDLPAIVALHDEARRQHKPVITAFSAGWGAVAYVFPAGHPVSLRDLFELPPAGPVNHLNYVDVFRRYFQRERTRLHPTVPPAVDRALTIMADGTPCPASQVSPGGCAVGALAGALVYRLLAGLSVRTAPAPIYLDLFGLMSAEEDAHAR